ncbi:hypothetical protein [Marinobacterium arenosum]|uniref:hypothetical protein n=1 Tax=Marinobacterium arenosum TaxID=2862496 RepID=UPI001C94893F|nr:hypothetical protein [Marinobacterium arenosum]MBY4675409.1 hypothetical protein [Marinobacterium arenosum]
MKGLLSSIIEFVTLAGLMILVPAVVAADIFLIGYGTSEQSLTQISQALLLLLTMWLFAREAVRQPAARGMLVLGAGFFGCMLIRECDGYLDAIAHGFWQYPAIALALMAILYARRCRGTVMAPMSAYMTSRPYPYLLIGLVVVLVFSRIFGTGHLWKAVMQVSYDNEYKSMIQEALELLGYVLIAYGACRAFLGRAKPVLAPVSTSGRAHAESMMAGLPE